MGQKYSAIGGLGIGNSKEIKFSGLRYSQRKSRDIERLIEKNRCGNFHRSSYANLAVLIRYEFSTRTQVQMLLLLPIEIWGMFTLFWREKNLRTLTNNYEKRLDETSELIKKVGDMYIKQHSCVHRDV